MKNSTRKRRRRIWTVTLAAVPLLGLIWAIVQFVISPSTKKPPVVAEPRFLLVTQDDLVDMVSVQKQTKFFADLPLSKPLLIQDSLFMILSDAFTPESIRAHGAPIDSAVFLAVTNAGESQAAELIFNSPEHLPSYEHLGKGETALLCMQIRFRDGTTSSVSVNSVTLTAQNGSKTTVQLGQIPNVSSMARVPGHPSSLGYPE
jgi:hypothetical protein